MSSGDSDEQKPAGEVSQVVEHLFRHEWAKMVATLTGVFGLDHLTLAEDVVQEALARALQTWPFYGVPKNPAAWIMRASRNLALDVVRREKVFRKKEAEISRLMEDGAPAGFGPAGIEQDFTDDRLRMMFVCCHPLVPADAQAALALKTLCGFSARETSQAFLTSEAAIAKRLTRAKQKIREERIAFEIPTGDELTRRLDGVLKVLYLLFNEGYKASSGDRLVRKDVCQEAIRLTTLLADHPAGNQPGTHGLLALMLLNAARFPARADEKGNLLLLKDQDRTLWDRPMMARGMFHLAKSASGHDIGEYHLQAGIAACHCTANDYESTDWPRILSLYDRLMEIDNSPIIALNRAVIVANVHGAKAGVEAVAAMEKRENLEGYYLFYAVLGELKSQLNDPVAAAGHFRKSLQLAETKSEQVFLSRRLLDCEDRVSTC
jgi:RNA polymerase sigma factor (sigma-70 family)